MKKRRSFSFLFLITIIFLLFFNTNLLFAGWKNDDVGDASKAYLDITKLSITKNSLQITLSENPYYNDSGEVNWRFYNIWIDTSMQDDNPDTTTWGTDVYEYVAHFDCRWNGDQWINNSYVSAFRYYLTADGSQRVEGSFYWNGNNWVETDPNIDIALISENNVTFNIEGAIFREQPLGTGYVIQGVANTSNGTVVDVAPNYGWVDEFDNMCEEPENTSTKTTPFSSIGIGLGLFMLALAGTRKRIKKKKN
ncbi:MAG: hypothetical protein ACTSX6_02705 [Candidatus Heimdallarchaeaceae archaeon]